MKLLVVKHRVITNIILNILSSKDEIYTSLIIMNVIACLSFIPYGDEKRHLKTIETWGIINAYFQKKTNTLFRKMETIKNGKTVRLVLPFPHLLWMLGTNSGVLKEETVMNELQAEQGNINRDNTDYEEKQ